MIAETSKQRTLSLPIEEIQPMSWMVSVLPDELRYVYGLRLPSTWIPVLKSLADIDHQPPLTSFYVSLRALAPEIISISSGSFSEDPDRRPPYWLLVDAEGPTLSEERFLWAIRGWLNACYASGEVRTVAAQLDATQLHWERIDLHQAPLAVLVGALPGLIARWLLKGHFEFHLTNSEGQQASYQVRLAPSSYGPEADLITWPVTTFTRQQTEHIYSYYLKFRVGFLPSSQTPYLFCQPGIRRWVSRPLANVGKNEKPYIDLVWGREKGVFLARKSASWLTQQPAETTFLRLGLRCYHELTWSGRLPQVLASLSPNECIPDPLHLLSRPTDFQPDILITYDTMMSGAHPIGAGIEEADRWEVFTQLTGAFPQSLLPTPPWRKTNVFRREKTSFDASHDRKKVPPEVRRQAIVQMPTPARIEICSPDAARWEQLLLEEVGAIGQNLLDGQIRVPTSIGAQAKLTVVKHSFPLNISAELPPEAMESDETLHALTLQRVRQIEKAIPKVDANVGVLLEMQNYQELYSSARARRRDPKVAGRWGLARVGRKLQCIQPESADPDTYEERVRNGICDLLRQMDYRWNPLYSGFKGTSLPSELDLLGMWQIRLHARRRGEKAVTIPLVIHTPAHSYTSYVCIPGEYGPVWHPYSDVQLHIPDFQGGFASKEGMRTFFIRAIQDRGIARAALLMISEHNLRDVFPEMQDPSVLTSGTSLQEALGIDDRPYRIARLRYSGYGTVPLVCPTHSFGKFTGLFHDSHFPSLFYSIQERPFSARKPTGVRQRDSQTRLSWNPSTVEILLVNLQENDQAEEWAWVVHRLRQESYHTDRATLLPEPLYSLSKITEYSPRVLDEE